MSQYTLALSIPKTVADPETVGACLDYLEWASFTECSPVVKDALCYKGVRDDDSIEMLAWNHYWVNKGEKWGMIDESEQWLATVDTDK